MAFPSSWFNGEDDKITPEIGVAREVVAFAQRRISLAFFIEIFANANVITFVVFT